LKYCNIVYARPSSKKMSELLKNIRIDAYCPKKDVYVWSDLKKPKTIKR
jgi:hypothetical protein